MKKLLVYGIVAILAVGVVVVLLRNGKSKEQTLVVHPADFVQQVSVSGKVVAAQNVDLGFSQSGRVAKVYGAIGDTVTTGSLLAEIENGDLRAVVLQKQAALESQQAKLSSLQEGARPEDLAVSQAAVDSAVSALAQSKQVIIDSITDAYTKSDDAIRNKVDQFITNPSLTPQLTFLTNALVAARNMQDERLAVEGILTVWQQENAGLTIESDILVAAAKTQKNLAAISGLLVDASAALSQATPSEATTQTAIAGYVTNVATARTTINSAISALSAAVGAQKSAVANLETAQKNLALKQAGSTQTDINSQAAQVKVAQADLGNAEAQLIKTRILAPFTGVITKMDAKVGQIVSVNSPEVSLIGSGAFQVESHVAETNISLIKVGNPATVTLDAYGADVPFTVKIISIDPAETLQDGVSTYRTVMQFDAQDPRIKSGMTANIIVTTEKKSNVISVPQSIIISKDGQKFVKVKVGDTTSEVKVETGSVSTLGQVEITSGLKDGDTVVLEQPQSK